MARRFETCKQSIWSRRGAGQVNLAIKIAKADRFGFGRFKFEA